MAVLLLASASGAPGVTTTALGLALNWPREVLLADCDRDPAQVLLAGRLRGAEHDGKGLSGLASAQRERRLHQLVLDSQTIALPGSLEADPVRRRYLPGFTHQASALLFESVWPVLATQLCAMRDADSLIDAGRIGREGLPEALVRASDAILVVCRTNLPALAGLRLHLPPLLESVPRFASAAEVGLVLIGEGQPYGRSEIERQFAVPVWAVIDFAPKSAAVWFEGLPETRRFSASSYARSVRKAARDLSGRLTLSGSVAQ